MSAELTIQPAPLDVWVCVGTDYAVNATCEVRDENRRNLRVMRALLEDAIERVDRQIEATEPTTTMQWRTGLP